ncbi:MAG: Gldg family protein [Methylobacter sp.]|nr:Gldg family protein [Methylobacter sp.]
MKISPHKHQQIRFKNGLITLALLCIFGSLAWLSTRYSAETDITRNSSNSLSQASQKLLKSLPDKIQLTAYIKKDPSLRSQIAQLVARYKRHKTDLALTFIDPDSQPEKTRELNIDAAGVIIVEYQGRSEKLNFIDESSLTNALLQLANADERWVTFLTGHGERAPDGIANFDLGQFGKELERRKIKAQALDLATMPDIPGNSALLVLTAPAVSLLPAELELIKRYIRQGGNLLLLTDPGNHHLDAIEQLLGLRQLPGTLVDSKSTLYGINDPSFVLASDYLPHPITQGFQPITVYPVAAALEIGDETDFQPVELLKSASQSWTETGPIAGKIVFDADGDEKQGPLAFAYALTRPSTGSGQVLSTSSGQAGKPLRQAQDRLVEQRIVVVGDGDFLSNAYLGNVGNLDMGLRMINWLIHDDRFIDIPAKIATDKSLQLSQISVAIIGFGFLIVIPLLLMATGFYIWRKRKQR